VPLSLFFLQASSLGKKALAYFSCANVAVIFVCSLFVSFNKENKSIERDVVSKQINMLERMSEFKKSN
jgi:hypothetical protein